MNTKDKPSRPSKSPKHAMSRGLMLLALFALPFAVSGCGSNASPIPSQPQPVPTPAPAAVSISSITPSSAFVGSSDLTVLITGTGLTGKTHNIRRPMWVANGSATALDSTPISDTQRTAVIPAALLAQPVSAKIFIQYGDPMGDTPLSFTLPVPFAVTAAPQGQLAITSISPSTAVPGSSDLTITLTGTNFDLVHAGSHPTITSVDWHANNTDTFLTTAVVNSTQLTAVVPAALMATPVVATISVQKIYFADDAPFAVSNLLVFTVNPNSNVASISPESAIIGPKGSQQFGATIDGSSSVTWSVAEGASGGSIGANGIYTPAGVGTFHVVATSTANSADTATARVVVASSGFAQTGSMHVARSGHTATLLQNGQVLILGGGDGSAELFDPATGTFLPTGSPLTNRTDASVTMLADGRVLVAGGLGSTPPTPGQMLPPLDTAEIYDPATGTFSATGNMLEVRWKHTAVLLKDGRVLISGGNGQGFCTIATSELFDPATGTFSAASSLISERGRVYHTATLLKGGDVLVVGGSNGCAPDAADDPPWDPLFAELYAPSTGNFYTDGAMSTTRIGHVVIHLDDDRALVLGGIPPLQNRHEQPSSPAYAEMYDPAQQKFSPIAGLALSQKAYTGNLLPSGLVLIAGGADASGHPVSEADLLDPNTGVRNGTGGLATARFGHTATLLKDGRVLVAGGTDGSLKPLASAEIYQ